MVIIPVLLPILGAIVGFLWPSAAMIAGISSLVLNALGLTLFLLFSPIFPTTIVMGGWWAPLGITLGVDGLSWIMLMLTALVATGSGVYASHYFVPQKQARFWPLWLLFIAAMNALFVSRDLFNLYVALELVGMAAVGLTALEGKAGALKAALRYLLAAVLGSLLYLLGVVLIYHNYGGLDLEWLALRLQVSPATVVAFALMAVGLSLKSALFPLHFWLPPAHSEAAAPISAVLSALVVKASFYILLRLWLELFAPVLGPDASHILSFMGAAAVVWGSIVALQQSRVKLLIAYSTVAQVGYLFLFFPLQGESAWKGLIFIMLAHGLAKSAMFLAAGNMARFVGHDQIPQLDSMVQRLPLTVAAFALGGISIIGLPPSGGFIGKWYYLEAALAQQRWDIVFIVILGGVLAAAYVFKVLSSTFTPGETLSGAGSVSQRMEWSALTLAVMAIALGILAPAVLTIVGDGP